MIQVVVEARQHQNGNERGSRFMLDSQRSHCNDKTNSGFVDSSEGVGQKGRMSSMTDRYRAGIMDGHRGQRGIKGLDIKTFTEKMWSVLFSISSERQNAAVRMLFCVSFMMLERSVKEFI